MKIAAITFQLHAPWVHSLMEDISRSVEEDTEAVILDEEREIR